jgi:hypothetical protein
VPFFAAAWILSIVALLIDTIAGWLADAGDLLEAGRWGASRPENGRKKAR